MMGADSCLDKDWNATGNATQQEIWNLLMQEENHEALYKIPTFILLCTLMVVGLLGNILVLVVYRFRFSASTTKSFIMAMASFDLLNCMIGMPFEMVDLRHDIDLDIRGACKFFRFLITLSACGSVTVLVAVSLDRFRRVSMPYHSQMTVRQSKILVAIMAALSVGIAVPALILYGRETTIRYGIELHDCSIDDQFKGTPGASAYQFFLGALWVICIVVLIIMYSFIIYNIRKQKIIRKKMSIIQPQKTSTLDTAKTFAADNGAKSTEGAASGSKEEDGITEDSKLFTIKKTNLSTRDTHTDSESKKHKLRYVMRLFSRNVNPIYESGEGEGEDTKPAQVQRLDSVDDMDATSLPEPPDSVIPSNATKASLYNYFEAPDAEAAKLSDTGDQTQSEDESGEDGRRDSVLSRHRKFGRTLKRARHLEAEIINPAPSVASTSSDREWTSHSEPTLDVIIAPVTFIEHARQVSSLPTLISDASIPDPGQWEESKRDEGYRTDDGVTDSEDERKPSVGSLDIVGRQKDNEKQVSTSSHVSDTSDKTENVHVYGSSESDQSNSSKNLSPDFKLIKSSPDKARLKGTLKNQSPTKITARQIKTSKVSIMMLMVTIVFILSYLPHLIIQVFKATSPTHMSHLLCTSPTYFLFHHLFMRSFFINNAVNPIIYSFYNKTFRDRCIKLLKSPKVFVMHSTPPSRSPGTSNSQDIDTSQM